ncbi:hypothetical protein [Parvularcula marina]|uniref:Uncharacterized protein n=1 Tax=Parvularcula marina TaxID=2292771 RepID=A0A371RFZ0_9PROT|nr:hypothetical protein [Parvularcula marina]RFB04363.1 hypothetical protein DX908_03130 [Parvularcula marina]
MPWILPALAFIQLQAVPEKVGPESFDPRYFCEDQEALNGKSVLTVSHVSTDEKTGSKRFVICAQDGFEKEDLTDLLPAVSDRDLIDFVVNSLGGNVELFMEIVEHIDGAHVRVFVWPYCFSSCANYILGIADEIYLQKDTLIGWHGGPANAPFGSNSAERRDEVVDRENNLFRDRPDRKKIIYDSGVVLGCVKENVALGYDVFAQFWSPTEGQLSKQYGFQISNTSPRERPEEASLLLLMTDVPNYQLRILPEKCRELSE